MSSLPPHLSAASLCVAHGGRARARSPLRIHLDTAASPTMPPAAVGSASRKKGQGLARRALSALQNRLAAKAETPQCARERRREMLQTASMRRDSNRAIRKRYEAECTVAAAKGDSAATEEWTDESDNEQADQPASTAAATMHESATANVAPAPPTAATTASTAADDSAQRPSPEIHLQQLLNKSRALATSMRLPSRTPRGRGASAMRRSRLEAQLEDLRRRCQQLEQQLQRATPAAPDTNNNNGGEAELPEEDEEEGVVEGGGGRGERPSLASPVQFRRRHSASPKAGDAPRSTNDSPLPPLLLPATAITASKPTRLSPAGSELSNGSSRPASMLMADLDPHLRALRLEEELAEARVELDALRRSLQASQTEALAAAEHADEELATVQQENEQQLARLRRQTEDLHRQLHAKEQAHQAEHARQQERQQAAALELEQLRLKLATAEQHSAQQLQRVQQQHEQQVDSLRATLTEARQTNADLQREFAQHVAASQAERNAALATQQQAAEEQRLSVAAALAESEHRWHHERSELESRLAELQQQLQNEAAIHSQQPTEHSLAEESWMLGSLMDSGVGANNRGFSPTATAGGKADSSSTGSPAVLDASVTVARRLVQDVRQMHAQLQAEAAEFHAVIQQWPWGSMLAAVGNMVTNAESATDDGQETLLQAYQTLKQALRKSNQDYMDLQQQATARRREWAEKRVSELEAQMSMVEQNYLSSVLLNIKLNAALSGEQDQAHLLNRGANELYTKVKLEGVPCVRWPRWVHEELYFAGGNKPSKPATVGKQ